MFPRVGRRGLLETQELSLLKWSGKAVQKRATAKKSLLRFPQNQGANNDSR